MQILCALVLLQGSGTIFAETPTKEKVEMLTQAQWNVPRSVTTIVNMPPLQKTIRRYQAVRGSRIQIQYAGGDEGTLWVSELRGWFVSLGIPSSDIELLPGAVDPLVLELTVIRPDLNPRQMHTLDSQTNKPEKIHE